MIEIIGSENSNEYAAAVALKNALVKLWSGVDKTPREEDNIVIVAGVKLTGYKRSDIDIVVAGTFGRKRYFVPTSPLKDMDGKPVTGTRVLVENFVVAIEEKGQDASGIDISGEEVYARYQDGKKSATQQNIEQVHALVKYFDQQQVDAWVYRCVFLQGLNELPMQGGRRVPASGAIALGASGADFLTAVAGVNNLKRQGSDFVVKSFKPALAPKVLGSTIFKKIAPSRLDRIRMDRISTQPAEAKKIAALLGTQRVHIRGHGGTGKTVLMLQAAHEAFRGHGKRCLVLTYNVALAADIRRLLALLGIPGRDDGGGVEVRTALSFIYSWLNQLGISSMGEDTQEEKYVPRCAEALAAFRAGALGEEDIAKVIDDDGEQFEFDAVIVDEAQDWPQAEAELLATIYGGNKIALADGLDQLLRGTPTNWKRTVDKGAESREASLVECLRMKRNLGIFANAVAEEAGLNWSVEPSSSIGGGRVIVALGEYASHGALVDSVIDDAKAANNEEIDLLHCVPASDVVIAGGARTSRLGRALSAAGRSVWDGVNESVRREFPRSVKDLRIVQYESCRGLEGWTTVLDGFDEFWTHKYEAKLKELNAMEGFTGKSPEKSSGSAAWSAAMMPLTRPMDTLVITLKNPHGEASQLLLRVAKRFPDFVTLYQDKGAK